MRSLACLWSKYTYTGRRIPRRKQSVLVCLLVSSVTTSTASFSLGSTRLFSNSNGAQSAQTSDDLKRWEKMYEEGARNNPVLSFTDSIDSRKDLQQSQVRVVSFDLDDTLWNTSATISAANEALANFLNELKIEQPKRVEKIMGELFQNDKERYCPIQTNKANSPTLLTLLRKDAIELVLKEYNAYTPEDAKEMADKSFDVWMQGRQDTIPLHLADGVVECLRRISSLKTIEGHSVVVGAITDGNCDPRTIPMLKDYFDFCVNAEQVGISKPAKDVYVRAIQEVSRHPSLQSFMADLVNKDDVQVGPWWVHVGDDFVKDVVAAKDLSMRCVWSRELIQHKLETTQQSATSDAVEHSVEELVKEISSMKVVNMQIGADDYLANSFESEFCDEVLDKFGDLGGLIDSWHAGGLRTEIESAASIPDSLDTVATAAEEAAPATMSSRPSVGNKFCLFCGDSLPAVAKFCSSCGKAQL